MSVYTFETNQRSIYYMYRLTGNKKWQVSGSQSLRLTRRTKGGRCLLLGLTLLKWQAASPVSTT